ncbi:rhodanese-like domain-containing protein [Methylopila henanensis]|uniref:Rhodanese-like domain-containing protein n=1 Tax=Methylopila henanensis TaxID=873516 RepID=A0ABW4K5C9_9HYPH
MVEPRGSYAGDVAPRDAWESLETDPAAALVDVRTSAEWSFVGVPDLSPAGKRVLLQEWQRFPSMQIDPGFAEAVAETLKSAGATEDTPVYFLCRSGARSQAAAAALAALGWTRAYNVVGGFEGPLDGERRRGSVAGWKADGLPWVQS